MRRSETFGHAEARRGGGAEGRGGGAAGDGRWGSEGVREVTVGFGGNCLGFSRLRSGCLAPFGAGD